jgi:hypothetical protein
MRIAAPTKKWILSSSGCGTFETLWGHIKPQTFSLPAKAGQTNRGQCGVVLTRARQATQVLTLAPQSTSLSLDSMFATNAAMLSAMSMSEALLPGSPNPLRAGAFGDGELRRLRALGRPLALHVVNNTFRHFNLLSKRM